MAAVDTIIQTAAPTILENFMVLPLSLTKSYRNDSHAFNPCCSPKEQSSVDKGNGLSPGPGLVDGSAHAACVWLRYLRHAIPISPGWAICSHSIRRSALHRRVVRRRLHHSAVAPAPS